MRKTLLVVAAMMISPVAGCAATADSPAPGQAPSSDLGTPSSKQRSGDSAAAPSTGRGPLESSSTGHTLPALPGADRLSPHVNAAPTVSGGTEQANPQYARDQIGAPITLSGIVDTSGTCAAITASGHRWAVFGTLVSTLKNGQRATISGRPTALPVDCRADYAITIRHLY